MRELSYHFFSSVPSEFVPLSGFELAAGISGEFFFPFFPLPKSMAIGLR